MAPPLRIPYTVTPDHPASPMPRLPLTLIRGERTVQVVGLVDTGAAVNVLPYPLGLVLGARWEEQTTPVPLVGSLGRAEARALVVQGTHPHLTGATPVRLVFAWTRLEEAPVIFGQTNFLMEFAVCFYRAQAAFDVYPAAQG